MDTQKKSINGRLETLHGLTIEPGQMTIRVTSTGTTSREDFVVCEVQDDPRVLVVIRTRGDFAKRAPYVVSVTFYSDTPVSPIARVLGSF